MKSRAGKTGAREPFERGDRKPNLLSAKQVAARLGVSVWFVYDHGAELGLVKLGGANRYRPEAVEAYVEERSRPTSVPVRVGPGNRRSRRERPGKVALLEPATPSRPERTGEP